MKYWCKRLGSLAAAAALVVTVAVAAIPAHAQGGGNVPQWIKDSGFTFNRYLGLWEYFTSTEVTKFELWTEEGDPLSATDNFFFVVDTSNNLVPPWGSRIFGSAHPPYGVTIPDTRPYCNIVTVLI